MLYTVLVYRDRIAIEGATMATDNYGERRGDEHANEPAPSEGRVLDGLLRERARLEAVLAQMPAGVILAEAPSGRVILGNEQVNQIWRHNFITATDIENYREYEGYRADGSAYLPEEWPLMRAVNSGEVVQDEEIVFVRGDGTRGVMSVNAAPIVDAKGQIVAAVAVVLDITSRKKVQAALARRENELQALNETLEQNVEERTQALRERSRQVEALASELTLAEQEERRRISQVLHDDVQQRLYAARMQLAMVRAALGQLDEATVLQEIDSLDETLAQTVGLLRGMSIDLSPPILEGEGLADAIGWLAAQLREQYGTKVKIEIENAIVIRHRDLRMLLFQLVRELLLNVVRHANVSRAVVNLAQHGDSLHMRVHDDGRGFDVATVLGGFSSGEGLRRIGHRLTLFGGHMEIKSAPGEGVEVTIEVPLAGSVML